MKVRLLPQSGRPLEDPSKGSENNAIIKIQVIIYIKDAAVKTKRIGTSNIQRPITPRRDSMLDVQKMLYSAANEYFLFSPER